jgi:hypothetical protein
MIGNILYSIAFSDSIVIVSDEQFLRIRKLGMDNTAQQTNWMTDSRQKLAIISFLILVATALSDLPPEVLISIFSAIIELSIFIIGVVWLDTLYR